MSWLEQYMRYTGHLESPTAFHQWVAIACAGHVMGRKVWLVRGGEYCIFPGQMQVVLVSPSAVARKSTAIEAGVKLLESLPRGYANVLPSKTSPQKILEALQPRDEDNCPIEGVDCVGLIVASELASFFSTEGFLETMATHVTALFDSKHGLIDPVTLVPEPREVKFEFKSWAITLLNPCAGMIGGTTPSGIANELPHSARQGGFLGRVLWIYSGDTDRPANDLTEMMPQNVIDGREGLLEGLTRMGKIYGPCLFSKQGKECFQQWYHDVNVPHLKSMDVDLVKESGYYGRRADHVLRVAMVLGGMQWDDRVLRAQTILSAIKLLREIERQLPQSLQSLGVARNTEYLERVLHYLLKPGREEGVVRRDIMKAMWRYGSSEDLETALHTLQEAGKVKMVENRWRVMKSKGAMLKLVVG